MKKSFGDYSANNEQKRWYNILTVIFVILFLSSDFIAATKDVNFINFSVEAKLIVFPISYFFDDVLTEVYGYSFGRRAIWYGFFALIFAFGMSWIIILLPAAEDWPHQSKLQVIYGQSIRIIVATLLSFLISKFINIYLVAKLKIKMHGRHAWLRSFGSSIIGETMDTFIFFPVAFANEYSADILVSRMMITLALKFGWLIIMIPVVHYITNYLEEHEQLEHYDIETNFNPFLF